MFYKSTLAIIKLVWKYFWLITIFSPHTHRLGRVWEMCFGSELWLLSVQSPSSGRSAASLLFSGGFRLQRHWPLGTASCHRRMPTVTFTASVCVCVSGSVVCACRCASALVFPTLLPRGCLLLCPLSFILTPTHTFLVFRCFLVYENRNSHALGGNFFVCFSPKEKTESLYREGGVKTQSFRLSEWMSNKNHSLAPGKGNKVSTDLEESGTCIS